MKIGILTFHWGTNYGAILQSYALQTYLTKLGHEVYIINYRPKNYVKTFCRVFFNRNFYLIPIRVKEYIKEQRLERFRKRYLNETQLFESLSELKNNPPRFDVYITGSDQVWNPYFTLNGEGVPTTAYFLDFGDRNIKRIGYAVSFGCEEYPDDAKVVMQKFLKNFDSISVREDSGLEILRNLGPCNVIKLPDPTLLLNVDDYFFPLDIDLSKGNNAVVYILRNEYKLSKKFVAQLKGRFKIDIIGQSFNQESVELWVNKIKNARFVITNSFHGMVFSLIFHIPFIIVLSKEKMTGMNDRFYSLLSSLNLQHRIVFEYDKNLFEEILVEPILWNEIDLKLNQQRDRVELFFGMIDGEY